MQERSDVQSVSLGTASAVHILPCLMQIHPEIGVLYEEDDMDSTNQGYNWLVVGKRVYLLSPDGAVHFHENIVGLLWHYREKLSHTAIYKHPQEGFGNKIPL